MWYNNFNAESDKFNLWGEYGYQNTRALFQYGTKYVDFLIIELLVMVILIKDVIVCGIIGQKT